MFVQVSSDTAQISCNTVTQYCSVFCLTAVIVVGSDLIYEEGGIVLLEE